MRLYLPILLAALCLGACAAPTLNERLEGKTGSARERELYNACLEQSNDPIPGGHNSAYMGHEGRMFEICNQMNKVNEETRNAKR